MMRDQIAQVILYLSDITVQIPVILGTLMISHIIYVIIIYAISYTSGQLLSIRKNKFTTTTCLK